MKTFVTNRIKRESFQPSLLGFVVSSTYLIRSNLHKEIASEAVNISGSVLDFGCGTKPYSYLFKNVESYIGIDTHHSGHDHTKSNVDVYYDGKSLPFPDQTFDAVVSFEVFEHVASIDHALVEVFRVLKPGGKLLLTTPFSYGEHEEPYDFARYTVYGIDLLLSKACFANIRTKKVGPAVIAIGQNIISYLCSVCPSNRLAGYILQLAVIFPLNVFTYLLNLVLPKRFDYYANIVTTCERRL